MASSSSFNSDINSLTKLHVLGLGHSLILALELLVGDDEDDDEDELDTDVDEHVDEVASLACPLILFGDFDLVFRLDGLFFMICSFD